MNDIPSASPLSPMRPGASAVCGAAQRPGSFLEAAERLGQAAGTASQADRYKQYLEQRFGPVTIESIGRDEASLDAAGKRMSGRDVVIAPNIFDEMLHDPAKAAHYEQKISYFFTDIIPNGRAWAASVGLTFEPCGVVVHEDGTVTYITGGGDTPERVAEVARINRERDAKRAERQRAYFEAAAATAALRRAQLMRTVTAPAVSQSEVLS